MRAAEAVRDEAQQRADGLAAHSEQEQRALALLVRRAAAKLRVRMEVETEVGFVEEEELLNGVEGAAGSVASVEGLIVLFERALGAGGEERQERRAREWKRGRERDWARERESVPLPLPLPPPPAAVDDDGDGYRSRLRAMQQKYHGGGAGGGGAVGGTGSGSRKSFQERVRLVQQTFQSLRADEQPVL